MIHIKIRSDFVTNSSSSSFVALKIKSPMLAEIIKHFKKEISIGEFQYNPCFRFVKSTGQTKIARKYRLKG